MKFFEHRNFLSRTAAMMVASVITAASVGALASRDMRDQVRYDDLDLTNTAGMATLRKRIHLAATRVCSATVVQHPAAHRQCVQDATVSALAQVTLKNAALPTN